MYIYCKALFIWLGETWRKEKLKYIFIFWKEFFFRMVEYLENLHVTKMNVNITYLRRRKKLPTVQNKVYRQCLGRSSQMK